MQNVWVESFTDVQRNAWAGKLPKDVADKWRQVLKLARGEEDYGSSRSGNWAHKGTPGSQGGSAPGGGMVAIGATGGHGRHDRIALSQKTRGARAREAIGGQAGLDAEEAIRDAGEGNIGPGMLAAMHVQDAKEKAAWPAKKRLILKDLEKEGYTDELHPKAKVSIRMFEEVKVDDPTEFGRAVDMKTGKHVFDIGGTKDTIQPSDKQLAQMKGVVFTHNHPGGEIAPGEHVGGTSFSPSDVITSHKYEVAQVRAVGIGSDGVHRRFTMTPETGWKKKISRQKLKATIEDVHNDVTRETHHKMARGEIDYVDANELHWGKVWPEVERRVWKDTGAMMNYQEETF